MAGMKGGCKVIDQDGFRLGVGIILVNANRQVFFGETHRQGQRGKFPQGGLMADETPKQAMFRELKEEIGITSRRC